MSLALLIPLPLKLVVDSALGRAYPGGKRDDDSHAWVMNLSSRIGLGATEAERADIRFRKRYGIG